MSNIALYSASQTINNIVKKELHEIAELHFVNSVDDIIKLNKIIPLDSIFIDRSLKKGVFAENEMALIRKNENLTGIPIVLLTSLTISNWKINITPKPDFVLPKPFDFKVVKQLIKIWKNRKKDDTKNKTILIVDDSKLNRTIIKKHLDFSNFNFLEASSSEEAYQLVTEYEGKIDLITLDLYMPGEDGLVFAKKLRKAQNFTPIILITAEISSSFKEKAFDAGVNFYLFKPTEKDKIKELTINILSHNNIEKHIKLPLVILINDSTIMNNLIYKHLQIMHFETISVSTAEQAIPLIQNNQFSLIVLDYFLPGMNANLMLRELKKLKIPEYNRITLVHTSSDDPFLIDDVFNAGASDFIKIPFSFQEFQIRTKNLIQSQDYLCGLNLKNNQYKEKVAELVEINDKFLLAQKEIIDLERNNSILAMIATANHDINQPLSVISGNLELLKRSFENDTINEKQLLFFNRIETSCIKISDLLQKYSDADKYNLDNYCENTKMVTFKEEENKKIKL